MSIVSNCSVEQNVLVSIIVPVFKVEKYICQCVDSILAQTYTNWELFLIDDGSPDASPAICDEYAVRDDRIHVIHKKNEGLSATRNLGIQLANGQYCLFIDSDDYIDKNLLSTAMKYALDYDAVHWSYNKTYSTKVSSLRLFDSILSYSEDNYVEFYARLVGLYGKFLRHPEQLDSLSPLWLKLYKTEIIKNNHLLFKDTKEIGTAEDLLFNIQYFRYAKNVICLPNCFYYYRRDNVSSFTSNYKEHLLKQWTLLMSLIYDTISDNPALEQSFKNRKSLCLIPLLINEHSGSNSLSGKYAGYLKILNSDFFTNCLQSFDYSYMPFYWKLFFYAAKRKYIFLIVILVELIQIARKIR